MVDDQRFAARRPDVLVYETGVLEDDITLAGPSQGISGYQQPEAMPTGSLSLLMFIRLNRQ